jgi:hypothetical protein
VATFVVTAAAAGPLYLRAAGESLLQDALRTAGSDSVGIEATLQGPAVNRPDQSLPQATTQALTGRHGHGRPIFAAETDDVASGSGGSRVSVRLTARDRVCDHLDITGRCPAAVAEVIVSKRLAARLGVAVGADLALATAGPLHVVGTYTVRDEASAYWFRRTYFHPTGTSDAHTDEELGDAPFTVSETFGAITGDAAVRAVADIPADFSLLRLSDA